MAFSITRGLHSKRNGGNHGNRMLCFTIIIINTRTLISDLTWTFGTRSVVEHHDSISSTVNLLSIYSCTERWEINTAFIPRIFSLVMAWRWTRRPTNCWKKIWKNENQKIRRRIGTMSTKMSWAKANWRNWREIVKKMFLFHFNWNDKLFESAIKMSKIQICNESNSKIDKNEEIKQMMNDKLKMASYSMT